MPRLQLITILIVALTAACEQSPPPPFYIRTESNPRTANGSPTR